MHVYTYRTAAGRLRLVELSDLAPVRSAEIASLRELVERNGDTALGPVHTEHFPEVHAELVAELESTQRWARQHNAEQLREYARRAVARYRARKIQATPETLDDFERYLQNFPLEDPRD